MAEGVSALLTLWFAASVVAQLPGRISNWLRAHDVAGLLPSWSFFAPNPARTDTHLVYRHVLEGGAVTPWTEAFVWFPAWYRALWNPDRRAEKAISDASSALQGRRNTFGVRLSVPYLLLLNYVSSLPQPHGAHLVQFALLGSYGSAPEAADFARFVSDPHPLKG